LNLGGKFTKFGEFIFTAKQLTMPPACYWNHHTSSPDRTNEIRREYKLPSLKFLVTQASVTMDYASLRCICTETGTSFVTYFNLNDEFDCESTPPELKSKLKLLSLPTNLAYGFTIGSDPEIFVTDADGKMIPAFLFLDSKDGKDVTSALQQYGSRGGAGPTPQKMYWDGFQAEFTTLAAGCNEVHTDSVAAGLRGVYDAARKRFPGAKLAIKSVFDIPHEMLMEAADEHVAFGCMPSLNAYGIKTQLPPGREVPFRSAGGHLHFGVGKTSEEKAVPVVKALDTILGVACVSLFAKFDAKKRRIFYGLPGEYRLPPHGIEYRPLSNAWLSHPFIMNLVIDVARKVVILGQKGWMDLWQATEEETIQTIVNCDVAAARASLEKNKEVFIKLLAACYQSHYSWASAQDLELLYNIFANGMETALAEPDNLARNWYLDAKDGSLEAWRCGNASPNAKVSSAIVALRLGKKI
jgi:hypothetical protein